MRMVYTCVSAAHSLGPFPKKSPPYQWLNGLWVGCPGDPYKIETWYDPPVQNPPPDPHSDS